MPQQYGVQAFKNPSTKGLVYGSTDNSGLSQLVCQGLSTKLNFTTAANVKTGAGRVVKLIVLVAGSGGNLTVNDCATTGTAATANAIFTVPNGAATTLGAIFVLDAPFTVGLTISAVPTGATIAIVYT